MSSDVPSRSFTSKHASRAAEARPRVHRQLDELDVALRHPPVARVRAEQGVAIAVAQVLQPQRDRVRGLLAEEEEEPVGVDDHVDAVAAVPRTDDAPEPADVGGRLRVVGVAEVLRLALAQPDPPFRVDLVVDALREVRATAPTPRDQRDVLARRTEHGATTVVPREGARGVVPPNGVDAVVGRDPAHAVAPEHDVPSSRPSMGWYTSPATGAIDHGS